MAKVRFKKKEPRKIGAKLNYQEKEPRLKLKACILLPHIDKVAAFHTNLNSRVSNAEDYILAGIPAFTSSPAYPRIMLKLNPQQKAPASMMICSLYERQ